MKEKELFFRAQCYVSNNTPDLYAYKHYDYDAKATFYRLADAVGEIIGDFITVKELVDFVQQDNLPDDISIRDFNKTGRLSDYEILYDFVHE